MKRHQMSGRAMWDKSLRDILGRCYESTWVKRQMGCSVFLVLVDV